MMKRLALAMLFSLAASSAWAVDCQYQATRPTLPNQQFIILQCDNTGRLLQGAQVPAAVTSTNLSGTVASSNVFQSIQVATATRNGCLIVNSAATEQWVFFGPIGSATEATSVPLQPGQYVSCATGSGGVLTDQVSITGTASAAFVANFQ